MLSFLWKRLLATIPVLLVVTAVAFVLLRLSGGDPAAILAGDSGTPETIAAIRMRLGLDRPLIVQFVQWCWQLLHGDLGNSILSNQLVTSMIAARVEPTLVISLSTILLSMLIGVPLGVLAAWKRGSWIDRMTMSVSIVGFALPGFALGYLWIYVFSVKLGALPVQGYVNLADGLLPFLSHIVLPTLTLSVVQIALIARVTRTSLLEILSDDFVRTARAKGLPERIVLFRHALKNAAVPIASVVGIGVAFLIGGVIVTESVFNLPGLGRLTVESVLARDYPVIQGIIIVFSGVYVVINLLVDLSYTVFDPRIRY
ncbi:MAG: binding-protein-dependent transport system inner rane component [Tardiphaga sp.]|nr:binding-protein-dependent transport system inner rane component [Tardiphaga sp.]